MPHPNGAGIVRGDYDVSEDSSPGDGSGEGFPHHPDLAGHQGQIRHRRSHQPME